MKKIIKVIFLVIFTITFVYTFISTALGQQLSTDNWDGKISDENYLFYVSIVHPLMDFIVCPVLVFTIFYFIGKKTNIVSDFKAVILTLFVGIVAGHYLGFFSVFSFRNNVLAIGGDIGGGLTSFLLMLSGGLGAEFFVALAAILIAYIRQNNKSKLCNSFNVKDEN